MVKHKLFTFLATLATIIGVLAMMPTIQVNAADKTYKITGSEGNYSVDNVVHTGNTLDNVLTAIENDNVDGGIKTIQFGDDELNIGNDSAIIKFSCKLTGKITGTGNNTINIINRQNGETPYIESTADITNTNDNGNAIYIEGKSSLIINGGRVTSKNKVATQGTIWLAGSSGTIGKAILEIKGGTIENTANGGNAISSCSIGRMTISGGTISSTTGYAIGSFRSGNIEISGGIVKATNGCAIYTHQYSTAKIVIRDTARITSELCSDNSATIDLNMSSISNAVVLAMIGGTVECTGTAPAIKNNSNGLANINAPAGKDAIVGNNLVEAETTADFSITPTTSYRYISFKTAPLAFNDQTYFDIPAGLAGSYYQSTGTLVATGGTGKYTFSFDSAHSWLSVNSQNIIVCTRPMTAKGVDTAQITVSDGVSTKTITIDVGEVTLLPLSFNHSTLYDIPAGTWGTSFTSTTALTATGGTGTYSFSFDPAHPWLSVNSNNKIIGTRPTTAQNASTATVKVSDGNSTKTITINVGEVTLLPLSFNHSTLYDIPAGTWGTSFTSTTALTATGGTGTYTFSFDPAHSWLSVNSDNKITGTRPITAQNASTASVKVSDGVSTKTITINVGAVSEALTPPPPAPTQINSSITTDNTPSISSPSRVVEQISKSTNGSTVIVYGTPDKPISKDIFKQLKKTGCILEIKYAWYTWIIEGNTITDTNNDINLTITKITSSVQGDVITFNIEHHGDLPAKAKLKVELPGYINEGTTVYLYKIVEGKRIYQSSTVSTGYSATFDRNSASQYVISTVKTGDLSAGEGAYENITPLTVIQNGIPFLIISVILATGIIVYKRKVNR